MFGKSGRRFSFHRIHILEQTLSLGLQLIAALGKVNIANIIENWLPQHFFYQLSPFGGPFELLCRELT